MVEGRGRAGFALEPHAPVRIVGDGRRQDFEGHAAIETRVDREYTSPMAPAARAATISYCPRRVPGAIPIALDYSPASSPTGRVLLVLIVLSQLRSTTSDSFRRAAEPYL
jgi:hypothetical protein